MDAVKDGYRMTLNWYLLLLKKTKKLQEKLVPLTQAHKESGQP